MADAELEKTTATITISGSSDVFTAIGEVIKFDGFLRVYRESYDDDNEQEDESHLLPPLKKGQKLEHGPIIATERFTQRPPRYTEAVSYTHLYQRDSSRPCPSIHIGRFALLVFADRWRRMLACMHMIAYLFESATRVRKLGEFSSNPRM